MALGAGQTAHAAGRLPWTSLRDERRRHPGIACTRRPDKAFLSSGMPESHSVDENFINGMLKSNSDEAIPLSGMTFSHSGMRAGDSGKAFLPSGRPIRDPAMMIWLPGRALRDHRRLFLAERRLPEGGFLATGEAGVPQALAGLRVAAGGSWTSGWTVPCGRRPLFTS